MKKAEIKRMAALSLLIAMIVVLQFVGGMIPPVGGFSISLVLLPIVVGSALYGWKAGSWLGLAFGLAVLLSGDAAAFMVVDPLATIGVVLTKGAACGFAAGLVYKLQLSPPSTE